MRKAFTLIEVFAALFLISVAMICFTQLVFALQQQRQMDRHRAIASDQLQNVLALAVAEFAGESRADDLTPTEAMCSMVDSALPGGTVELKWVQLPEAENAALLQGTLTWDDGEKRPRKSLTMVRLSVASSQ